MATTLKNKNSGWTKTVLNDPQYFRVVGSGVDVWVGKKNFLSTKSVQGTKIASIESEVDYFNRPSRANMQPKVGRVAFAKMRDTFKVLLSDEELSKFYILSTGFALIEPQIESTYLYQVVQTQRFNLQKDRYAEGSTQQAISQSDFDKLTISFPEDRQEQRKIAEVFATIDDAIEKTDTLIEKYKRMKTGMMQDLFRYGIDDKGKIRSEKTHKFKSSPLGRIPIEWSVSNFELVRHPTKPYIKTGPFGSSLKGEHWVTEGTPVITIGALGEGSIIKSELMYITPKKAKSLNAYRVSDGDLDFSRVADVGRSIIISNLEDGWVMSSNLMRITLDVNKILPRFTHSNLIYDHRIREQINRKVNAGGREVANTKILSELLFILPALKEQKRICEAIALFDELISNEIMFREKLFHQKCGLMEDLLTGAVRVNHLAK